MSQRTCVVMGRTALVLALVLPFVFVVMGKLQSVIEQMGVDPGSYELMPVRQVQRICIAICFVVDISAIVAAALSRRASIRSPDYSPPPPSGSIALLLASLEGMALVVLLAAIATHC